MTCYVTKRSNVRMNISFSNVMINFNGVLPFNRLFATCIKIHDSSNYILSYLCTIRKKAIKRKSVFFKFKTKLFFKMFFRYFRNFPLLICRRKLSDKHWLFFLKSLTLHSSASFSNERYHFIIGKIDSRWYRCGLLPSIEHPRCPRGYVHHIAWHVFRQSNATAKLCRTGPAERQHTSCIIMKRRMSKQGARARARARGIFTCHDLAPLNRLPDPLPSVGHCTLTLRRTSPLIDEKRKASAMKTSDLFLQRYTTFFSAATIIRPAYDEILLPRWTIN